MCAEFINIFEFLVHVLSPQASGAVGFHLLICDFILDWQFF